MKLKLLAGALLSVMTLSFDAAAQESRQVAAKICPDGTVNYGTTCDLPQCPAGAAYTRSPQAHCAATVPATYCPTGLVARQVPNAVGGLRYWQCVAPPVSQCPAGAAYTRSPQSKCAATVPVNYCPRGSVSRQVPGAAGIRYWQCVTGSADTRNTY